MPEDAPKLDLSTLDFRPLWAKDTQDSSAGKNERPTSRDPRPVRKGGFNQGPPAGRQRKPGFRGPKDRRNVSPPRREEPPSPPPNPFPWLRLAFTATAPAVEMVAKQIRQTGKTFSLFDLARILLRNPSSYTIDLTSAPKVPQGPFYIVAADGSAWMSKDNALRHILRTRMDEFYRAETVEVAPPKGNFLVVAVCGISGTMIGPPNHHDFERCLRELHREKFSRMDFEHFRGRLKMERQPELIEKWKAAASKVVEYYPKEGDASEKLADLVAVEKHFIANYAASEVQFVAKACVPGDPKTTRVDPLLAPMLNHAREEEERFPLRLAQSLSRALTAAGLRFHKSSSRTTFVCASRPRYLDLEAVPISDSIRKILETIREKKSIRRDQLLQLLAPLSSAKEPPVSPPTEEESPTSPDAESKVEPAVLSKVVPEASVVKTPDEAVRHAVVQDILWLTHEGYVIEYSDSRLEAVPPPKISPKASKEVVERVASEVVAEISSTPPVPAEQIPPSPSSEP
mgnify:CR=1 FL=1